LKRLLDGLAYFASPDELNDSLEAKFDFAGTEQFAEVFNRTMLELALLRGYSGNPESFKGFPDELRAVNENENARFQLKCREVGIYSAARRPDNQAMWAYYGGDFQGVCFHLEWPEEIIQKYQLCPAEVLYSKESRVHNRADDFRKLMLELGRQNPNWTMSQLTAFSMTESFRRQWGTQSWVRAVSTKHSNWEHEQEVRMLATRSGALPIMKDILKSVIFRDTKFKEWGEIMRTLYQHYPDVQVFDIKFEHKEPFVRSQRFTMKSIPMQKD
jgi:hypothetical protein